MNKYKGQKICFLITYKKNNLAIKNCLTFIIQLYSFYTFLAVFHIIILNIKPYRIKLCDLGILSASWFY